MKSKAGEIGSTPPLFGKSKVNEKNQMKKYTAIIYSLSDADGVFYVGCTTGTVEQRLQGHIGDAKFWHRDKEGSTNPKIQRIIKSNFQVVATILEITEVQGLSRRSAATHGSHLERKWIQHFKEQGCEMCNSVLLGDNKQFVGKTVKAAA